MGPYAGADYITSPYVHSRVDSIHGQPYAKVDLSFMPEATLSLSHVLWIWPMAAFDYGLDLDEIFKFKT
jgi:hypothetical protein